MSPTNSVFSPADIRSVGQWLAVLNAGYEEHVKNNTLLNYLGITTESEATDSACLRGIFAIMTDVMAKYNQNVTDTLQTGRAYLALPGGESMNE